MLVRFKDMELPLSNEFILSGHSQVVSSVATDPSGSMLLTGSYDSTVLMYDFHGMDSGLPKPFRHLSPFDGRQVRALSWSPTGDRFLAITASSQLKVYDRDGRSSGESVKGDMYIRDLKHTKGHISGLTCGQWHPLEKHKAVTASEDGSVRVWDVTDLKAQVNVIKPKLMKPGRVSVTTCRWCADGNSIGSGLADGSIQIWDIRTCQARPSLYLKAAHTQGEDITSLAFASDGTSFVSRGADGTLKLWDIRLKQIVRSAEGLESYYAQTNVVFSPSEDVIVTGTSAGQVKPGRLVLLDKQDFHEVAAVDGQSVVCCEWSPRMNQIVSGSGMQTRVSYDSKLSNKGALLCIGKAPRVEKLDCYTDAKPVVKTPHALPLFRDEPSRKRQREKARNDPVKSRRPEPPVAGPGHGGRIGSTSGSLLAQYLFVKDNTWRDEDPQQAILRYHEVAAKEPKWISPAYAETQPVTILAEPEAQ